TAAYMSPEQAKGSPVDRRTDIFAFGCVLYEMLTSKRAFEGGDVSDTLAAVLRAEPDWRALPSDLPTPIVALLKRCLDKDRLQRAGYIAVVRFVLSEPTLSSTNASAGDSFREGVSVWRRVVAALVLLVCGAALATVAWWFLRPALPPPLVTRFT